MNPEASRRPISAFTLVELLTVIAIIGILAALLLLVLDKSEGRAKRVVCINQLGQIGLAFHTFSNDHGGKFPMAVSTNDGGSLEYVQSGFNGGDVFYTSFRQFQPLASELVFPQLLRCPADTRVAATNFASLQNENLSYFVGVQGTFDKPYSILAGDRNLATNSYEQPTILQLGPRSDLGWTWEVHQFKGNVLFADTHVEEWNNSFLAAGESQSPFDQSLFLPSVMPAADLISGAPASGSAGRAEPSTFGAGESSSSPSSSSPQSGEGSSASSGYQTSETGTDFQAQAPGPPPAALATAPETETATNGAASTEDSDAGMSPVNRSLTKAIQHGFEWLYLLLCILVLLYLLYRLQRQMRERASRRKARKQHFVVDDASNR